MEGLGREADPPLSHGFKVGLGTMAIAALYERVLAREIGAAAAGAPWPGPEEAEQAVRAMHPDGRLADAAVTEALAKHPTPDDRADHLDVARREWPRLRERLAGQLLPAAELRAMLAAAGCPTAPEDIGLSREELRATYTRARTIRRRYTLLDLAYEADILDDCVAELFAPGGFWAAGA
jgi:glycerol-1-phosphate dehydrogenase [NAD(P)+]